MLLILLHACSGPDDSPSSDSERATVLDSDGPAQIEPTRPTWGASDVETAIADGLAEGLGDPVSLRDWFLGVLGVFQAVDGENHSSCGLVMLQTHEEDVLVSNWFGDCEALDGTLVTGGWIHSESWSAQEGTERFDMNLLTSLQVHGAHGEFSVSGGQVSASVVRSGSDLEFEYGFGGDYDLAVEHGVLSHPVGGGLFVDGSRQLGVLSATLDGGVRHGELSLYFEDVVLDPETCEGFSGRVRVRDPSSAWLMWEPECSTCGPLSYEGEVLGEVCAGEELQQALQISVNTLERVERW